MTVEVSKQQDVGLITIDSPPVNTFSREVRAGLKQAVRELGEDSAIHCIVIIGGGKTFISGADLAEFATPIKHPLHRDVLDDIESSPKPCVAALHGTVLGAGLELAAACHYRIAAPQTVFGMPEVTLGVVPGAGGTQRLPRLMGLGAALELLLTGRSITAAAALGCGLIDAIAGGDLRNTAIDVARRRSGEPPQRTRDRDAPPADPALLDAALAGAHERLPRRAIPALIVDAVRAGLTRGFEEGMRVEAELSARSLEQVESQALRHLFFAERATLRIEGIDRRVSPRAISRVAIVGSGTMGGGIAMSFLDAGVPVSLLDVSAEALNDGMARVRNHYDATVRRGRLTQGQVEQRMRLLSPVIDYAHLGDVDLVIEAAPEKLDLKQEIFRKLDEVIKPGAILATNTSTLDINELAEVTARPADVVGLHFFSPANVMRLLEIIRTDRTADDVIVTAFALARRLKKIGVLSRVCYGFIGNRMMEPYQREAEQMVLEGAEPQQIDDALESFGMAMGILAVHDMAGIDVGELTRLERRSKPAGAERQFRCSALLYQRGWLGQKTGRGFYTYEGRSRRSDPEATSLFRNEAARLGLVARDLSAAEIQRRCVLALVNEGARILAEGIAQRASDIDVVYTSGYGFPRDKGGPMFWADTVGLKTVLAEIEALEAQFGSALWRPAPLLAQLAAENRSFTREAHDV